MLVLPQLYMEVVDFKIVERPTLRSWTVHWNGVFPLMIPNQYCLKAFSRLLEMSMSFGLFMLASGAEVLVVAVSSTAGIDHLACCGRRSCYLQPDKEQVLRPGEMESSKIVLGGIGS